MSKVILVEINVRNYVRSAKFKAAQDKINEYITNERLDVASVSSFRENEDEYIFTLTVR